MKHTKTPAGNTGKKATAASAKKANTDKAGNTKKTTAGSAPKATNSKTATPEKKSVKPARASAKKVALTANFPVIPIAEAVARTQQWCDYNLDLYHSSGVAADFARAFFVGKDDIQALHDMFQADSNLIGCRMYLGMQPELKGPDGFIWSLCMVAVERSPKFVNGIDIVRAPDSGDSLVFDFSKPCPNSCDLQSELYHPLPPLGRKGKK